MTYNPNILPSILQARSLSEVQLSDRLRLEVHELRSELQRLPEPRQSILKDIAKELALPTFVFFMERVPELEGVLPDFRAPNPAPRAKARETIEAIQLAEGIQRAVSQAFVTGAPTLPVFNATENEAIDRFALATRTFFQISLDDQRSAKDAREFYIICRKRIEDRGIFVLHESFPETDGSGFCLAHPLYPVVVVNTKRQTRGRRLFTLVHELAHVLMGKSGISDPFVRNNEIERRCNRFAGAFLIPDSFVTPLLGNTPVKEPDVDDVRFAARRLKVSQEAAVLRLEQLRFYNQGSHEKWRRLVHNLNPDFAEKGGGGTEPPPQEKVKLAKYGFRFAQAFDEMLRDKQISEINLYRTTGLKPKYARAYFDYARSISAQGLKELDDG